MQYEKRWHLYTVDTSLQQTITLVPQVSATVYGGSAVLSFYVWWYQMQQTFSWNGTNRPIKDCRDSRERERFTHKSFVYKHIYIISKPLSVYVQAGKRQKYTVLWHPWYKKMAEVTEMDLLTVIHQLWLWQCFHWGKNIAQKMVESNSNAPTLLIKFFSLNCLQWKIDSQSYSISFFDIVTVSKTVTKPFTVDSSSWL